MDAPPQLDLGRLARTVRLPAPQVAGTLALLDAGNTVPFITRYRRDQTGGLDEEQIRRVEQEASKQRQLTERKGTILRSIESQGKLTPELAAAIEKADSLKRLEDLYLPYKAKKQTRATLARERGLAPLAEEILTAAEACADLAARAATFVDPARDLPDAEAVLQGARDIVAEQFNERADLRQAVRAVYRRTAQLTAVRIEKDDKQAQAFRDYFEFAAMVSKLPPHRVLAINRGEKLKVLRVKIAVDEGALQQAAEPLLVPEGHPHAELLREVAHDALARLLVPSLERELRRELTESAEGHGVRVFARNLRNLLLQPPVCGRRVLAIDPGFKSGCKLVALDEFGSVLEHTVIWVVGSQERKTAARTTLVELVDRHQITAIAIGNGTACRQTEELLTELLGGDLEGREPPVSYVVVNEAGASVYSASPLGREELPDYDATVRGSVSIGRRLQDPLSELVKIDPASIGVGLYQHDVKAKHLQESLDNVVRSCVNYVGVDLNMASPALLRHVSGLNQLTARRLYDYRVEHGPFRNRRQLLDVPGLGEAKFVQAAGFLKIDGGDNPLDRTWIHPESYDAAERLLQRLECRAEELAAGGAGLAERIRTLDRDATAADLDVGRMLLDDLLEAIARPGRDPREDLAPPMFRQGVMKLEDLNEGMQLTGKVLNVVDFGAFVDVGLKDSGLVHVSQMSHQFVRDPHEQMAVGDTLQVWVREIDTERRRVSLTMIEPGSTPPAETRKGGRQGAAKGGGEDGKPPRRSRKPQGGKPKGGKPQGRKREGGKPQGRGRGKGAARPAPRPKPKPKPVVPITREMEEGSEPMRTFGDLQQFFTKKKPDEPEKSS